MDSIKRLNQSTNERRQNGVSCIYDNAMHYAWRSGRNHSIKKPDRKEGRVRERANDDDSRIINTNKPCR